MKRETAATKAKRRGLKIGTRVRVNRRHWGLNGSTGRITAIEQINGHTYYKVKHTGGRGRGSWCRHAAQELDITNAPAYIAYN